jgi:pyridoxal phosphate enzyme (YggS family)
METLEADLRANLAAVRARISASAARAGRRPEEVRLIAISKTVGLDHIRAAVAAGQQEFGENRVQEALQKIGESTEIPVRWHLVGHLQSNKVRKAVGPFAWIHSVDSVDLLERIDAIAAEVGASPELLVQIDLAGEPTKHGAPPDEIRLMFERAARCRAARVRGLMVLPPLVDDPEAVRPFFRRLREIRDALADDGVERHLLDQLSMGMSHDFEVAVEEGATMVRVGTAIFGPRR